MTATLEAGPAPKTVRVKRRGRRVTFGHIAPLLLGLLGAVFVLGALKDSSATQAVAVAKVDIALGGAVNGSDVTWVKVHRSDALGARGLLSASQLFPGQVAAVAIRAGQAITAAELSASGDLRGLGSMSIGVPVSRADGGAIAPGDRVDVISTVNAQATYVATDLLVLGVAQSQGNGVLGAQTSGSYYVTVAVDRATALALAAAQASTSAGGSGGVEVVRSTGEGPGPASSTTAPAPPGNRAQG